MLAFLAAPVQCPHVAGFAPTTSVLRFGDRRVLLAVRVVLRPAGRCDARGCCIHAALLLAAVVGLAAVLLHQMLTDGLCHGSCSLTPTPSGRPP